MKTWYIQQTHLNTKLSQEEQRLFCNKGTCMLLEKGQMFAPSESTLPEGVHIITRGYAKLLTMNTEGKRFAISILQPGDFLGSLVASQVQTRSQSQDADDFLEMMSNVEMLCVDKKVFQEVITQNPQLCINVLQILQGRTQTFQRKVSDLLFKDVHARIAQLFLDLTFSHGEKCPYAFGLKRDLRLKHHEIAELVGASRPVTSMALSQFLKHDLIHKHDGLICLNDIEGLKRVVQLGANGMPVCA